MEVGLILKSKQKVQELPLIYLELLEGLRKRIGSITQVQYELE